MTENPLLYTNFGKNLYRISTEKITSDSPDIDPDTLSSGTIASIIGTKMNITGNDIYLFDNSTGGTDPITGDAATIFFPRSDDNTQQFLIRKRAGVNYDDENVQEMFFDKAANNSRYNYLFIGRAGDQDADESNLNRVVISIKNTFEIDHYNAPSNPLMVIANSDWSELGVGTAGGTRTIMVFKDVGTNMVFTGSPDFTEGTIITGSTSGSTAYVGTKIDANNFKIVGIDKMFETGETVTSGAKSGVLSSVTLTSYSSTDGSGGGALLFGQIATIAGVDYGFTGLWLDAYCLNSGVDIKPVVDNYYDIGDTTHRFKNIYAENIISSNGVTTEFVYGEVIVAKNSVMIGNGSSGIQVQMLTSEAADEDYTFGRNTEDYHRKVHEVVDKDDAPQNIKYITVRLKKVGSPTDNVIVSVKGWGGVFYDVDLGNGTISNASIGAGYANIACTLSSNAICPTDHDFAIQLERSGSLDNDNYFCVSYIAAGIDGDYTIGFWNGSNWGEYDADMKILYVTPSWETGKIYKTKGDDVTRLNFFGFAVDSGSAGDTGTIQFDGVVGGLSSLTTGAKYYISDTAGAISATKGTCEKQVGIASSSTELDIQKIDHWEYISTASNDGCTGTGSISSVPVNCNFIVCHITNTADNINSNSVEIILSRTGKTTGAVHNHQGGDDFTVTFDSANNQVDWVETGDVSFDLIVYYYT
jgi:hypothetical protein